MKVFTQITLASLLLLTVTSCQEKKLDRLSRMAKDHTERNCPRRIDEVTTLDSIVFSPAKSMDYRYCYSLTLTDEQRTSFLDMKDDIRDGTLKDVRNSIEQRSIKESRLNISYEYYDASTHKLLATFTYTPEEYE